MALKPAPKAILILAVVSAAGYAFTKFMPTTSSAASAEAVPTTVVAPPAPEQVQSAAVAPAAPAPVAAAPVAQEEPRPHVTSGDAGLSAVLGAGR